MSEPTTIEVFADVGCPFAHVGIERFVALRHRLGRDDVVLWVRSWPLEIVNGHPLDAHFIAEEVDEIREQVAPDLFAGFAEAAFPSSTVPAMALAAAAYRRGPQVGERVSLALRRALFEEGRDVADPAVLDEISRSEGIEVADADAATVRADHVEGAGRGVVGSPYFVTAAGSFFCPSLDVHRDDRGHLRILADPEGFDEFLQSCFG